MKKYKIQSWKLSVEGEYETEEIAIKDLSDKYMQYSKCDPPNEHCIELINGKSRGRNVNTIGKSVTLLVFENVYGIPQWLAKYNLTIHPFKRSHWWPSVKGFVFEDCDFRYKVESNTKEESQI